MSESPAARWHRVQEHLLEALELEDADRATLLRGLEDDLRAEVEDLLRAHATGGLVADRPDEAVPSPGGQSVGPFRLIELLGTGGMGAVYLAERQGPDFAQRVALKLIRAGFADPRLDAQLKQERRILARLEHPGIARLIDGGTTETGQSWLAMEFVAGQSLAAYCREHGLAVRPRIGLMLAVCDAIGHAHQRLVVHGDLKPGNILVTPEGRPKVLDFGIAELLDPSGAPASTNSAPWLTPAYASPEQVTGQAPTTLTDVYALGVILYELLVEELPYQVDGRDPEGIRRAVLSAAPSPPSVRAGPPRLRRELAGDLDAIVLKALARDPGDRYRSVEALADDLRRHLDGRPVRAHPGSAGYRIGKFLRRHRVPVAAVALVLATLLVTIAVITRVANQARSARDRAQAALVQSETMSNFLVNLFQEADPLRSNGDTLVARALLQRGLASIEGLDGQPGIQSRMLDALGTIVVELGQYERGRGLIERGLRIRQASLGPGHPDVALSLTHLGRALRAEAAYDRAESVYRAALAIQRGDGEPDGLEEAETLSGLGFLMPYLGRVIESEEYYRQALAIRERLLPADDPRVNASRLWVALALRRKGDDQGAEVIMRSVLAAVRARHGPEHSETADAALRLADLLADQPRGTVEAESLYRRVIAIRRGSAPEQSLVHPLTNLAGLLGRIGKGDEAERDLHEGLAINTRVYGAGSSQVAASLADLAEELERQGRLPEAEAVARRAIDTWTRATSPEHPATSGGRSLLARILEAEGRLPEAERIARDVLATRRRTLAPSHSHIALSLVQIGELRLRQGAPEEAEPLVREAVGILERQAAPTHPDLRSAYRVLARVCERLGQREEAARYRRLAGEH